MYNRDVPNQKNQKNKQQQKTTALLSTVNTYQENKVKLTVKTRLECFWTWEDFLQLERGDRKERRWRGGRQGKGYWRQ